MKQKVKNLFQIKIIWQYAMFAMICVILFTPHAVFLPLVKKDQIKTKIKSIVDAVSTIILFVAPSVGACMFFGWKGIKMKLANNPSEKAECKGDMLSIVMVTGVIFMGTLIVNFVVGKLR
jgi:TRAP-type mannitol/chloroaromatic compound transport system permease small subunit